MLKNAEEFLQTTPKLETPAYVVDVARIRENREILRQAQQRSGATILLALKGFAMWSTFPTLREVLGGVSASSPWEAQLGFEEFGKQVHGYAPAYSKQDIAEMVKYCDHIVLNSLSQWELLRNDVGNVSVGLRINPEHSEVKVSLYDPCAPGSRLGITREQLGDRLPDGVSGIHMHTLCELGADALERTVRVLREKFSPHLAQAQWLNLGGGHHITRPGYDIDLLAEIVSGLKADFDLEVYLEPGEAIALHTGWLVATVLDIVHNAGDIAILDTSATAHMPDVLEMPYRPEIVGADGPGVLAHTYRLGGLTCLAGDVVGDYSFGKPLQVGDRLVFRDMAHYTMVKNTAFNGVRLPSIVSIDSETGRIAVERRFHYEDYRSRLS